LRVIEFIQKILIEDIGNIQQTHKYHFISFALIALGIEYLGACLDPYDFNEEGLSEKRFRQAIKTLFKEEYQKFNCKHKKFDLYENLRCGMLHIIVPGSGIVLSQSAEGLKHLKEGIVGDRRVLVLVAEDFYSDFKAACNLLIGKIEKNELQYSKVISPYLNTEAKVIQEP
jgi:hypothetical protein